MFSYKILKTLSQSTRWAQPQQCNLPQTSIQAVVAHNLFLELNLFFELSFVQDFGSSEPPLVIFAVIFPNFGCNYAILDKATQASELSQREEEENNTHRQSESGGFQHDWVVVGYRIDCLAGETCFL